MTSSPRISRRERERRERRQAMLAAARAVFAERGYQQANLEEIARRAEFGKGTLYNYFPGGKDELLREVLDALFADLRAMMAPLLTAEVSSLAAFRQALHAYLERLTRYFYENRGLFHLTMRESYRLLFSEDAEARTYLQQQIIEIETHLARCLDRYAGVGIIKAMPERALAHAIVVCAAQHIAGQEVLGWPTQADRAAREAADFLTELLVAGIGRGG